MERQAAMKTNDPPLESHEIVLRLVLSLVIGGPLLFSGIGHIANLHLFLESVYRYNLLPIDLVPWVASGLSSITAVVGVSLVFGLFWSSACVVAAGLYLLFATAQAAQLFLQSKSIDCGCFVWISHPTSYFNVAVLLCVGLLALSAGLRTTAYQPRKKNHEN